MADDKIGRGDKKNILNQMFCHTVLEKGPMIGETKKRILLLIILLLLPSN